MNVISELQLTSEVNSLHGSIAVFPPEPGESSAGRAER